MVIDTSNSFDNLNHLLYATKVRFTYRGCYFTYQCVCSPVRFAFIFVSPQPLLDQLARTRGAAGNSATPFLCHRLRLSLRQSLPFPLPSTFLPSLLPSSLSSTLPIGPASHCGWSRPLPPSLVSHLYTLSLSRPGLSLWQVPPGLLPPSPTSLLLSFSHFLHRYLPLYPLSISSILARLVIVAGPA